MGHKGTAMLAQWNVECPNLEKKSKDRRGEKKKPDRLGTFLLLTVGR